MRFFRLSIPSSSYDGRDRVVVPKGLAMPCCHCEVCDRSTDYQHELVDHDLSSLPLADRLLEYRLDSKDFTQLVKEVRSALEELEPEAHYALHPGTLIGPQHIRLQSLELPDLVKPLMYPWVLNQRVVNVLTENKLTGFTIHRLVVDKVKRARAGDQAPPLWFLGVHGEGGRPAPGSADALPPPPKCHACGQDSFVGQRPQLEQAIIDQDQWDGTDFFHIEGFENGIVITERVKVLFEEAGLTGWEAVPLRSTGTTPNDVPQSARVSRIDSSGGTKPGGPKVTEPKLPTTEPDGPVADLCEYLEMEFDEEFAPDELTLFGVFQTSRYGPIYVYEFTPLGSDTPEYAAIGKGVATDVWPQCGMSPKEAVQAHLGLDL